MTRAALVDLVAARLNQASPEMAVFCNTWPEHTEHGG